MTPTNPSNEPTEYLPSHAFDEARMHSQISAVIVSPSAPLRRRRNEHDEKSRPNAETESADSLDFRTAFEEV